jgi:putative transposase
VKLVFAVLIRSSDRWQRVVINDIESAQLRALRRELGLDPPPGGTGEERSYVERKTVA